VVESYIRSHVGPVALIRDLVSTVEVLARFGPRLPRLVEDLLIAQAEGPKPPPKRRAVPLVWATLGAAALLAAGVWAGFTLR
jgi:ubiquinone biosynthesis protein